MKEKKNKRPELRRQRRALEKKEEENIARWRSRRRKSIIGEDVKCKILMSNFFLLRNKPF